MRRGHHSMAMDVSWHVGIAWPRSSLCWGRTLLWIMHMSRARDHLYFLLKVTGHNMQSGPTAGPKPFFCSFPLRLVFPSVWWLCIGGSKVEHCLTQTILEAYGKRTSLECDRCFLANALLLSSVLSSSKVSKCHCILSNWAPTLKRSNVLHSKSSRHQFQIESSVRHLFTIRYNQRHTVWCWLVSEHFVPHAGALYQPIQDPKLPA